MAPGTGLLATEIVAGSIVAAVGAVLTYVVGKRSGRQEYEQIVKRLDTTVYGQDGVEPIKGLAEIASSHEDRIQENYEKMEQTREEMEELRRELDEVREMVAEVKERCERNVSENR